MDFGFRCSSPAHRPCPASTPVRLPAVVGSPPASFSFTSRLRLAVRLRLAPSPPLSTFQLIRHSPCRAHWHRRPRLWLGGSRQEQSHGRGRPCHSPYPRRQPGRWYRKTDRVEDRGLRPCPLPHHRIYRFQYPAVEVMPRIGQDPMVEGIRSDEAKRCSEQSAERDVGPGATPRDDS